MISPDGTSGDIPIARMQDAQAAGFKPAVKMTSPDGQTGYIPADRIPDATKAGFKQQQYTADQVSGDAVLPQIEQAAFGPQRAQPGEGLGQNLLREAANFGGAAAGAIPETILHPVEAAKSAFALSPLGMAYNSATGGPKPGAGIVQSFQQHPEDTAAQLAGGIVGGAALGPALGDAAAAIAPKLTGVAGNVAGRMTLLGKTPEEAYTSALKPSTVIPEAQRAGIVQSGLQNEIPVSKAGAEKLGDLIDDLNSKIKSTIASDPNRPIDPNIVAKAADVTKAKFTNQVNAQPDLDAIEAVKQQFLKEQGGTAATAVSPAQPAPTMGVADAQAMKQGTYRVLAGKYGEQGSASVEAQKALARGLKEEIANQFPEINGLNAEESKLLDLQPVLERAVNRISNHQAIGIGTPIAGTAVKALTGNTGAGIVATVLKSVLDNPAVKSRLAIAVSKSSNVPILQAMDRVQAYSSTLGAYAGATQANSPGGTPNQSTTPAPVQ
jgi:hypothetical protein